MNLKDFHWLPPFPSFSHHRDSQLLPGYRLKLLFLKDNREMNLGVFSVFPSFPSPYFHWAPPVLSGYPFDPLSMQIRAFIP